jgi:YVTN family beta-propeller protein
VQYFERARFEYHPEHAGTPSEVLLGRLGVQQFAARYPNGQPTAQTSPAINVWAATTGPMLPSVANLPPRVYVPDELRGDITVIDPRTFQIIDRYPSGVTSHHVAPNPDLSKLYVNNMGSNNLLEIDAQTGKPIRTVFADVPYNLYFTTDGTKAIVAAEPTNRLDFYDPVTWRLLKSVPMGCSGVDHLDMSATGRYLLLSCEFDGQVIKVDTVAMEVIGRMSVGGLPVDVKLSPDGSVFYIANQGRHGVSIIDPIAMKELAFLPTGQGAHGLAISRDTRSLYVANRLAGTIATIDFASGQIVATWFIGGSPDMLQVSPDGTQLWASGRFNGAVYVVDTTNGTLMATIPTGTAPHGLAYFPQPGQISIGHNGVYR